MEVYLVRHGQSEYNIGLTDYLDSGLTEMGQEQAARTAARLSDEGLTHIYVSPLRRTLETAGPICAAAHLRAEALPMACEFFSANNPGYHTFPGLSPEQITHEFPWAFLGDAFPVEACWWPVKLETPPMLVQRAEHVRDALLRLHAGTEHRVLVISHADTVGRLMEVFLRSTPYPDEPPWMGNCSVTRLHCGPDIDVPATLVYANDVSHVADLSP
jgi:probable phosphoglycerate mutase